MKIINYFTTTTTSSSTYMVIGDGIYRRYLPGQRPAVPESDRDDITKDDIVEPIFFNSDELIL